MTTEKVVSRVLTMSASDGPPQKKKKTKESDMNSIVGYIPSTRSPLASSDQLTVLPLELQELIFSFLDQGCLFSLAMTCKTMHRNIQPYRERHGNLKFIIDGRSGPPGSTHTTENDAIMDTTRRSSILENLCLIQPRIARFWGLCFQDCPRLKSFALVNPQFSLNDVQMPSSLKRLTFLSTSIPATIPGHVFQHLRYLNVHTHHLNLPDKSLWPIQDANTPTHSELLSLSIKCKILVNSGTIPLKKMTNLTHLDLDYDDCHPHFDLSDLPLLTSLTSLRLRSRAQAMLGTIAEVDPPPPQTLRDTILSFTRLTSLSLTLRARGDVDVWYSIPRLLTNLRHLHLNTIYHHLFGLPKENTSEPTPLQVHVEFLESISALKKLTSLSLGGDFVTLPLFDHLKLPNLHSLTLNPTESLDLKGRTAFFAQFTRLNKLCLRKCDNVASVIPSFPKLQVLHLECVANPDHDLSFPLQAYFTKTKAKMMQRLTIKGVQIDTSLLQTIVEKTPNLLFLDILPKNSLTAQAVVKPLPGLIHYSLGGNNPQGPFLVLSHKLGL